MILDRTALDLPDYDGLLAGHYRKEPGYGRRREHGTDDWLLIATLSGSGRFVTAAGEVCSEAQSCALIAPGTPHDYGSGPDGWELLWVHFHPPHDWLDLLAWPQRTTGFAMFAPVDWQPIDRVFREVVASTHRQRLAMNSLERLLILLHGALPDAGQRLDGRIAAAVEYVHTHLNERLSVEDLCRRVHLSPSRFAHLFRQEVGVPPSEYVDLQRVIHARHLLERTTLSVKEISASVGLDPFHFSTRFRAHTGLSPRAYRNRHLG